MNLQNAVWYDSNKGQLTYTTNQMTGYTYSSYSYIPHLTGSVWTCFLTDGDYVVSKASSPIFGSNFDAYICQLMTKITSYSYYYYIEGDNQTVANNERMNIFTTGSNVTLAQACAKSASIPKEEFHVLVKSTNMADVKQWLPTPLLGTFEYTKVSYTLFSSCGTGSVWDVCNNRKTMTFNMTQCNSVVAFSQGEVYGVFYLIKGSTYYVVVVNPGIVDDSTYFRFTCMAVTQSGTTVKVVEKSGSCVPEQTSAVLSPLSSTYTLTPYAFTTDIPPESNTNIGIIIGSIIALLILIAAVVAGVIICKKMKRKIHVLKTEEEKANEHKLEY